MNINILRSGCSLKSCLSCSMRQLNRGGDPCQQESCPVKNRIVSLVHEYIVMTQLFYVEKTKTSLITLKQNYPDMFDVCLHNFIYRQILGDYKVKFHLRKFIQGLFIEMPMDLLFCETAPTGKWNVITHLFTS